MHFLPSFSGKMFKLWEIKIEGILGSIDLWEFVKENSINSQDKSRGSVALFLIISSLGDNTLSSILHEYGEIHNVKIFWIL